MRILQLVLLYYYHDGGGQNTKSNGLSTIDWEGFGQLKLMRHYKYEFSPQRAMLKHLSFHSLAYSQPSGKSVSAQYLLELRRNQSEK